MKILIATGIYPPQIGGPATYTKLLEEELPRHDIEVNVLSFGDVKALPKGVSHLVYFVRAFIKSLGVDVVYALDPVSVGLPACIASLLSRTRFMLRVAGDYAWEQGTRRYGITEPLDTFSKKHDMYPLFVRVLKNVQAFVARHADTVIVPSSYLKNIVANWGISADKIRVIYNSFDPPENLASKKVLRELMQMKGTVIISAGRLVPWKGFEALIDVMPHLARSVPNLKLLIVGSGPEEEHLRKHIENTHTENNVTLVGALPHETLLHYLKAGDLFVLNTFYEGFSHLILEALALGVPTVTTRVGGNPEIIEHKKNGLLGEYDSKKDLIKNILLLLKDKTLACEFSKRGERKAAEFSEERMIESLLKELKNKK